MRLVIDIRDDLVDEWGTLYIHNPQYDAAKVLMLVPGFKYKDAPKGEAKAVVLRVLKSPINNIEKQKATPVVPDKELVTKVPEKKNNAQPKAAEPVHMTKESEPVAKDETPQVEDTAPKVQDNSPPIPPDEARV